MSELGEEKIDIIEWAEDEAEFVAKALGPAEVNSVKIDKDVAAVQVSDDQLSLAIGKEGQNVRLAAKLTDKKIDIMSPGLKEASQAAPVISSRVLSAIEKAGISLEDMLKMTDEEVLEIKGIGKAALEEIRNYQDLMTKTEEPSTPEATTSQGENSSSETEEESETEEKPVKEDDSREEQVDENLDNKEEDGKEKGTDKVE
jgi:hypothetical protein